MPNLSSNQIMFYIREELSVEDISYLKDRCGETTDSRFEIKDRQYESSPDLSTNVSWGL